MSFCIVQCQEGCTRSCKSVIYCDIIERNINRFTDCRIESNKMVGHMTSECIMKVLLQDHSGCVLFIKIK